MTKKFCALIIALLIVFASLPVFAGNISVSTSVDVDRKQILLSGEALGNTLITVVALDVPKAKAKIIFDNSNEAIDGTVDELVALKQLYADGEYETVIGMPGDAPNCKYMVYVTAEGQKVSDDFVYYNGTTADDKVELIIKAKKDGDKAEFKSLISSNPLLIGIDETSPTYIKNSDEIFDMLYDSNFIDRAEFVKNYNLFSALCDISESDEDKVLDVIGKHKITLGVEPSSISGDERLNEDILSELYNLIINEDYKGIVLANGIVDFADTVNNNKALATMRLADNWGEIKNCITADFGDVFASLLQNNFYLKTEDKDEIFKKMIGHTFKTYEDVDESFKLAAEKTYYEERNVEDDKPRPGGFGGSAVTPVMPPVDTVDKDINVDLFSDLADEHWSYAAVSALESKGIISGYPDKTFRPDAIVTRAEFTKMIMTYKEETEVGASNEITFSDVSANDWFYPFVMKAAKLEIVQGAGGMFSPSAQIKREDAALIIYRMLIADGKTLLGNKFFKDRGEISEYARDAVATLGNAKIINGDETGNFAPQSPLTRAEAAQIIYNAFEN